MSEIYSSVTERAQAARAVARAVLHQRGAGEALSDAEVLAAHSHLLPELADELRKLALIARAARAPGQPGSSAPRAPTQAARIASNAFPGYDVIGEIARGGQGAVFEAVQAGTQRRVAIKLIHRGHHTRTSDLTRFDREARILARLKHPNIVAIHECGAVHGDPYFVMDFIDGVALDVWIAQVAEKASAAPSRAAELGREILQVFETVTEAVEAAHLHGVIHRDLKPANIRLDQKNRPYVLDFGLAKPADGDSEADGAAPAAMTQTGQFVGSLPWSSPEQAMGRVNQIDLRTDVYALGVMLFRALSGRFPYEVSGALPEVVANILEAVPGSLRAADSPLARCVDRDLEAIVLRCLAKERERRYQSAGDLARDLQRYRRGEAIDARRDSTAYLLRKALWRHRAAVSVAAGFLALIGGSAVTFFLQAQVIREQRDEANEARAAEHTARVSAERVTQFLQSMLSSADPFADPEHRRDVSLLESVKLAEGRIEREFAGEPLTEASVRTVIGRTHRELGAYAEADSNLRTALDLRQRLLPPNDPEVAETAHELALLRQAQTRYAEAEALCSAALRARSVTFGADSVEVAGGRVLRAHLLRELGRLDEAEVEARHALAIRSAALQPADPLIAESHNALAGVLRAQNRLAEAEHEYEAALAGRRARFGNQHPDVATSLNNLATLRCQQKRFPEATPLLREALDIYVAGVGANHPYVARAMANLAGALRDQGALSEAEPLYRQALEIRAAVATGDDSETALLQYNLGILLERLGRDGEARPLFESALQALEASRGAADALTQRVLRRLIALYQRTGEGRLGESLAAKLAPSHE